MEDEIEIMKAMLDDEFQQIMRNDLEIKELEAQKFDSTDEFFELMACLSKTYSICGVCVSVITPAIWAYLYCLKSPYVVGGEIHEIDTDLMLYILHNGVKSINADIISNADGFCRMHNIDWEMAKSDLMTLVYLAYRPLEMLPRHGEPTETPRYNLDWLTGIVALVSPLTGKTSDEIIYDMSLTECYSYAVQKARESDIHHEIYRKDSDEINAEIYRRTMELGRQYYEKTRMEHIA